MNQPKTATASSSSSPLESLQAVFAELRGAAEQRIHKARLGAWLSGPIETSVGPFKLIEPSLRSLADLEHAGNLLVADANEATEGDVLAYIWRHLARPMRFGRFCRKSRKLDFEALSREAFAHLIAAYDERPVSEGSGGLQRSFTMPAVAPIASYCDELASAYGLDPSIVADWPIAKVFQLLRASRMRRYGAKYGDHPEMIRLKSHYLQAKTNLKTDE